MRIREILDPQHIVLDLHGSSKRDILTALSHPIAASRRTIDHARLVDALVKREETSTTAIADGIAIPHGKLDLGEEVICGFGLSREGLEFDSIDGNPTHLFFLLISPESYPSLHLRWLAHLAVTLKDPEFRKTLVRARTAEDVLAAFDGEEDAQTKREAAARGS
jgi:mannitol/fructose-specific phosphotransferase system IIA component (Ntr-type)